MRLCFSVQNVRSSCRVQILIEVVVFTFAQIILGRVRIHFQLWIKWRRSLEYVASVSNQSRKRNSKPVGGGLVTHLHKKHTCYGNYCSKTSPIIYIAGERLIFLSLLHMKKQLRLKNYFGEQNETNDVVDWVSGYKTVLP